MTGPFIRLIILVFAAALGQLLAGPGAEPLPLRIQQAVPALKRGSYPYLISLPSGYKDQPEQRWPLLLFLHGAGHRGNNLWQLTTLGPPKLVEQGAGLSNDERAAAHELTTKFIVISPQCAQDSGWEEKRLLALLDQVQSQWRIDPSRVYATGASMGGGGTWLLATRHPARFAAVGVVCGRGVASEVTDARGKRREALRSLGVWAFHNDRDPTMPLQTSQNMINAFKAIDAPDVQFTIYPGTRHDSWTKTYANVEFYSWLLRHERPSMAVR